MRGYTLEQLISLLQEKARELGHTPTMKDVTSDPKMPAAITYLRFFDSWNAALMTANIAPNRARKVTK